jgi:hypothetical protein
MSIFDVLQNTWNASQQQKGQDAGSDDNRLLQLARLKRSIQRTAKRQDQCTKEGDWNEPKKMRVNAPSGLNVRGEPNAESKRVGGLDNNKDIVVKGRAGEWSMIDFEGNLAYVKTEFLQEIPEAEATSEDEPKQPQQHKSDENAAAPQSDAQLPPPALAPAGDANQSMSLDFHEFASVPAIAPLVEQMTTLQQTAAKCRKGKTAFEEEDRVGRHALVDGIASMRAAIAALDQAPVDEKDKEKLPRAKAAFYRAIDDLSPYYHQKSANIVGNALATTCNITALSMALENRGIRAQHYVKDKKPLVALAQQYGGEIVRATGVNDKGSDSKTDEGAHIDAAQIDESTLDKMRFPDFMQLVVLANNVENILSYDSLAQLAGYFGVPGTTGQFHLHGKNRYETLANIGGGTDDSGKDDRRHRIMNAHRDRNMDDPRIKEDIKSAQTETDIRLDDYRSQVLGTLGAALDRGQTVVAGMAGHYIHLQGFTENGVKINDPGEWGNAHTELTWEAALAVGLFWNHLLLG